MDHVCNVYRKAKLTISYFSRDRVNAWSMIKHALALRCCWSWRALRHPAIVHCSGLASVEKENANHAIFPIGEHARPTKKRCGQGPILKYSVIDRE